MTSGFDVSPLPENPQVYTMSSAGLSGADTTAPAGISSVGELQKIAPKVWSAMMQAMAWQICTDSDNSVQRIKETLEEAESQDQG